MANEDPADLAKRARTQGKNAAKNTAKAARLASEPVLEEAKEVVSKLEETADDAVQAARRIDPRMMGRIASDAGQAFLALSAAIYIAHISANKFRAVFEHRKQIIS